MQAPDPEKLNALTMQLAGYLRGVSIASSVSLGVRLGLYHQMRDAGPVTSEQLAKKSGYHERWVREWLHAQAAAEVIAYQGNGLFELPAESAALLTEPSSLRSLESVFGAVPERFSLTEKVEDGFKSGTGFGFGERGRAAATLMDGVFGNWQRQVLVEGALPAYDGVIEMLTSGVAAADVGCGSGTALLEMAKAFPKSTFHGYDNSAVMLSAAAEKLDAAQVSNASFYDVSERALPDSPTYHFVLTFDCLHDMSHPDDAASAIRKAMHPEGVWFIADIDGAGSFEDNLRDNPRAAGMYANSIYACLASSMSEPDSVGYGSLGLPESEMEKLVRGAGFTSFRRVRPDTPGFALPGAAPALYEARP